MKVICVYDCMCLCALMFILLAGCRFVYYAANRLLKEWLFFHSHTHTCSISVFDKFHPNSVVIVAYWQRIARIMAQPANISYVYHAKSQARPNANSINMISAANNIGALHHAPRYIKYPILPDCAPRVDLVYFNRPNRIYHRCARPPACLCVAAPKTARFGVFV